MAGFCPLFREDATKRLGHSSVEYRSEKTHVTFRTGRGGDNMAFTPGNGIGCRGPRIGTNSGLDCRDQTAGSRKTGRRRAEQGRKIRPLVSWIVPEEIELG